ncbi:DUF5667 domain-containing protein [Mesobacillus subterraneus]|uniref:DUF5667 domain-containing protein n=1 Tax=Mesobacillus subterraneus TaxID=285983 RepID=UPI0020407057|nr:DUF5667 domain-containing protein [Mesobacillus subterraneus]MCM3573032.1 DUF5667 domain-containing protein [Mesobacillus subterraneus]
MKKLSNQEMKKIAKSTLALVLAGTFTFSPIAMAEENNSEVETVELQNVSPEEIEEAKTQVDDLEETNPSLIPGDFFYFAKIALEKIRLAFTLDNAKEAELLATYAAERLQEASALFAEGKEEEALKVIEAAVEYMESSQEIVDEEGSKEEDTDSEEETGTEEEVSSDEETESEELTEDGNEPADDVVAEEPSDEDAEEVSEEEEVVNEDPFEEIEGMLRQNIVALKAAMEHVGNDNARAQLQKNIDKTYAKMAKKLAKLEGKYAEKPVEEEEDTQTAEPVELEPIVEPDLLPADETPAVEEPADETLPVNEDANVVPVVSPKAEKEKAKQERKAEKAAEKQERKEAKQQKKAEKQQAKQEKKAEKKSNHHGNKGNGNGKGNDKN